MFYLILKFCIGNQFSTIQNLNTAFSGGIHAFGNCRNRVENRFYNRDINRMMVIDEAKTQSAYDGELNDILMKKIDPHASKSNNMDVYAEDEDIIRLKSL